MEIYFKRLPINDRCRCRRRPLFDRRKTENSPYEERIKHKYEKNILYSTTHLRLQTLNDIQKTLRSKVVDIEQLKIEKIKEITKLFK